MDKIDLTIRAAECCQVCKHFQGYSSSYGTSLKGMCSHPDLPAPRKTRREGTCNGFETSDKGAVVKKVMRDTCPHNNRKMALHRKSQPDSKYYTDKMPRLKLAYVQRCADCDSKIYLGKTYNWTIFKWAQKQDKTGKYYFTEELNPDYEFILSFWKQMKNGTEPLPEVLAIVKPEWSRYW